MKFPLPADTFHLIVISSIDAQRLEDFANDIVQERIAEFHKHSELFKGHVDLNFWKKIKVCEQITVYTERHVAPLGRTPMARLR